jgi:hypothetical protein
MNPNLLSTTCLRIATTCCSFGDILSKSRDIKIHNVMYLYVSAKRYKENTLVSKEADR